ncbi:MAG: hypothetical protein H6Q14_84 [Bacteroidetes bacterium]|nr:hypothetical protein [Bacteroidota bacterium]
MNEILDSELPKENGAKEVKPIEETSSPDIQPEDTTEELLAENEQLTKDEIIQKLKSFLADANLPARAVVESLKHAFFKIVTAENEKAKTEFVENGNNLDDFVESSSAEEEEFKNLYNKIKEKRAEAFVKEEALKEENLKRKLAIIESIRVLVEEANGEEFSKQYNEFKKLQQEWNEIKLIPQARLNELWKSYQIYSEKFYDLVRINNELRDYDFRKNLELKTAITEAVERLQNEPDPVSAFYQLQNFHQEWREIGPVSKEIREETWVRFKEASSAINKNYQKHFESLKVQEEENLIKKTDICEKIEAIDLEALKNFKDWDSKSKEILELQAFWKTISFVPKKLNTQIFERFRAACDRFFEAKAAFFKTLRDEFDQNLAKKTALCERAEALKDSTDWKKTGDELVAIQREWKTIGQVPRKYSDSIWKRFVTACDYFFEQKKKNTSSQHEEELANLEKKKQIIKDINDIPADIPAEEARTKLKELLNLWHEIGFVPFKEKDKIYKEMQKAADAQFDRLRIDKSERRLQAFKSSIEGIVGGEKAKNKLYYERERLMRQFDKIKGEIQTYENNIGFLSVSSKGGGGLFKDMEHKIQSLKDELKILIKKIETIDTNINNEE